MKNTEATPEFSLTVAKDIRGDFVSHVAGCKDLTNGRRVQPGGTTYRGADVVEAIKAADADMAAWFGLEAYDTESEEQAWTFCHTTPAPCLKPALKGLTFAETGEPSLKAAKAAAGPAAPKAAAAKALPDYAGLRESQVSRETGALVSIYNAEEAGQDPESGPWSVVCESHGETVNCETRLLARGLRTFPSNFCEPCRAIATDGAPRAAGAPDWWGQRPAGPDYGADAGDPAERESLPDPEPTDEAPTKGPRCFARAQGYVFIQPRPGPGRAARSRAYQQLRELRCTQREGHAGAHAFGKDVPA